MEMSSTFDLPLKKGNNNILIKSETAGKEWCVFIQPPSEKDAVLAVAREYPEIGLKYVKNVDKEISKLTNWLVIGPFAQGIDLEHAPEKEFIFGRMYKGAENQVTWTIPKIEILGDVIDAAAWGTTYQWNYHNGGVAWAMQQLGESTHEDKYKQWAVNFCDYQMEGLPFVDYQVNNLRAYNSANVLVINSTLLDFTLAPSLPIIYRLRTDTEFKNKDIYKSYIVYRQNDAVCALWTNKKRGHDQLCPQYPRRIYCVGRRYVYGYSIFGAGRTLYRFARIEKGIF